MRKRDIQSFTLKLSDLKEFEAMRLERAAQRAVAENKGNHAQQMSTEETPVSGGAGVDGNALKGPLVKFGPKKRQEIRERLGLPDT